MVEVRFTTCKVPHQTPDRCNVIVVHNGAVKRNMGDVHGQILVFIQTLDTLIYFPLCEFWEYYAEVDLDRKHDRKHESTPKVSINIIQPPPPPQPKFSLVPIALRNMSQATVVHSTFELFGLRVVTKQKEHSSQANRIIQKGMKPKGTVINDRAEFLQNT